jgi:predicted transcriptional regulator
MVKTVNVKLDGVTARRLDELAAACAGNRSEAVRRAIMEASGEAAPSEERDVVELLAEQARAGSVPAARALLQHFKERERERAAQVELSRIRELTTQ